MSTPYSGDPGNDTTLPNSPNVPNLPPYGNAPNMPPAPYYPQTPPYVPPAPTATSVMAPAPKRSHRGLWITLSIIVVLLIILGGAGYYLYTQYTAPGIAATQFCNDLKNATYSGAYNLLSSDLKGQFTEEEFALGAQELDAAEGKVTACSSGAYSYTVFATTASVTATLARTQPHTGVVHLKQESGAWKVSALDTSLLGANLAALKAAAAFCAALQAKDYTAAFALLDPASLQGATQVVVNAIFQAQDVIDGPITGCALTAIASGNTDTTTNLTVSVTRTIRGAHQGQMTLTASGATWRITTLSTGLFGTDVRPVLVAAQLCADLASGNLAIAYQTLTSTAFKAAATQAEFEAFFKLNPGESFAGCTPDLTTYKLQGTNATFDSKLNITVNGTTVGVPITLTFVFEGGNWLLDNIRVNG